MRRCPSPTKYIQTVRENGCHSYVHNPILEARHWGIVDGQDVAAGTYHRTHSGYAVAAFHEALRITLQHGRAQKARDYAFHEKALRDAVTADGLRRDQQHDQPGGSEPARRSGGREKELVGNCRAVGFGIWPTLSEPVQVRIGILNQITPAAITDIVNRFGKAMNDMGATSTWRQSTPCSTSITHRNWNRLSNRFPTSMRRRGPWISTSIRPRKF